MNFSSGSSGRGGGGKKHEIYTAAFGGHLFYDLFLQDREAMAPSTPPSDPLLNFHFSMFDIIVGSLTALERSCSVTACINNKILSRFLSSSYLDLSANSQTSITDKSFTFFIVLQQNGLITFFQSIADLRYLYHFLDLNLKL